MQGRKPNRLHGYDYSRNNLYFVTSCVYNRICCFGNIASAGTLISRPDSGMSFSDYPRMILNKFGIIAEKQWNWIQIQYPYTVLHEFVVMPNHIHGIIEINRSRFRRICNTDNHSTKIKSLSELMGAYKTSVSKQIHLSGYLGFAWQRSFYENIVRNEISYYRISEYIINNPANWNHDKFYK
jgi:putative transposase